MSNENFDISIISDFVKQLEHCHTVFDVSRTVIRNFVGYFMPEKAVFFLAPNASYPFYKCIDRYAVPEDFPQEIPGNGGLMSLTRNLKGVNFVEGIPLHNLITIEQKIIVQFQYVLPIKNETHYAGLLFFTMRGNKNLDLDTMDHEYLQILSAISAKTFHSLIKPVDLHLDKVTKLFAKDYLWAMMDHYKYMIRELIPNREITYEISRKAMPRKISIKGENGENAFQIGYTIILIRIQNLSELNKKFDFEKGNQVLQQFGLELKLLFRRSDMPCRYDGSQFIVLLPFTTKAEAMTLKDDLQKTLTSVKVKQFIPQDFPISLQLGFAHFPSDGEENYLLINSAEKAINDKSPSV